ncbi:hypothetical protein GOV04_00740 [Candidatus Woesearchaeota archaeon]|nr:hypothetical protein [Candidatus Woesearchaeota archaeon]
MMPTAMAAERAMFGSILDSVVGLLQKIFSAEIKIPHPGYDAETVALWQVIAVFLLLFSIVYVVTGQVPPFKGTSHAGARKGFAVAVALLAQFGSPVTEMIADLISGMAGLGIVLTLVLAVIFAFIIFSRALGFGAKVSAKGLKDTAEGMKTTAEAIGVEREARQIRRHEYEKIKEIGAEKKAFGKLRKLARKEIKSDMKAKEILLRIDEGITNAERISDDAQMQKIKNKLLKEVSHLVPLVGTETNVEKKRAELLQKIQGLNHQDLTLTQSDTQLLNDIHSKVQTMYQQSNKNYDPNAAHNEQAAQRMLKTIRNAESSKQQLAQELAQLSTQTASLGSDLKAHVDALQQNLYESQTWPQAKRDAQEAVNLINKSEEYLKQLEGILNQVQKIESILLKSVKQLASQAGSGFASS